MRCRSAWGRSGQPRGYEKLGVEPDCDQPGGLGVASHRGACRQAADRPFPPGDHASLSAASLRLALAPWPGNWNAACGAALWSRWVVLLANCWLDWSAAGPQAARRGEGLGACLAGPGAAGRWPGRHLRWCARRVDSACGCAAWDRGALRAHPGWTARQAEPWPVVTPGGQAFAGDRRA